MDPSVYIPAYLERTYLASHPELTDAARELVHNDISANPQKYAQSEHAQALLSYAGVHRHLLDELHRIEDMGSDEEFEQTRNRLFDDMRDELLKIVRIDAYVLDGFDGRCDGGRSHRERAGTYRVAPHARGHLAAVHGERPLPRCRQLRPPRP